MKDNISAFFPCYNDEQTIAEIVRKTQKILKNLTADFEIIVIDDKSIDQSRKVLKKLQKKIPQLKLIFHEKNLGYGQVLKSGFKAARQDLIFYTDGDGQYDVYQLLKLLSVLEDDIDIVQGFKIKRNDPVIRRLTGKIYQITTKILFRLPVSDPNCDFRLIRKKILKGIVLKSKSAGIGVELVKKIQLAGGRFKEVGINHYPRVAGESQFFNIKNFCQTLSDLVNIWKDIRK